jgi:hypothetical protein
MSLKVIERNRVKVYDSQGNLVEERDATFEDLKNKILEELANNYYLEFTFTLPTGQVITVQAKLKKTG